MKITIKRAGEVKVGDQFPEADGYLFTVKAIETAGDRVTFTLANDFSPMRAARDGIKHTCNRMRRMHVVEG